MSNQDSVVWSREFLKTIVEKNDHLDLVMSSTRAANLAGFTLSLMDILEKVASFDHCNCKPLPTATMKLICDGCYIRRFLEQMPVTHPGKGDE